MPSESDFENFCRLYCRLQDLETVTLNTKVKGSVRIMSSHDKSIKFIWTSDVNKTVNMNSIKSVYDEIDERFRTHIIVFGNREIHSPTLSSYSLGKLNSIKDRSKGIKKFVLFNYFEMVTAQDILNNRYLQCRKIRKVRDKCDKLITHRISKSDIICRLHGFSKGDVFYVVSVSDQNLIRYEYCRVV